jgi:hypothetical protein
MNADGARTAYRQNASDTLSTLSWVNICDHLRKPEAVRVPYLEGVPDVSLSGVYVKAVEEPVLEVQQA